MSANIETDPFFTLLTDALRAGPASPEWHDAIAKLRAQGLSGSDEYKLLVSVRQSLESGRDYRAVRAGAGFTRKVMAGIDSEPAPGKRAGFPTAMIVAVVCGFIILGIVIALVVRFLPQDQAGSEQAQIDQLAGSATQMFTRVSEANFAGAIPEGWTRIGSLPLDASDGLRPAPAPSSPPEGLGGGIYWSQPLPSDQDFLAESTINAPKGAGGLIVQIFVASDKNFSPDKGISGRELVWQLSGGQAQVVPNGAVHAIAAPFATGDTIRLIVGKDVAIAEEMAADTKKTTRLWAGPSQLGTSSRYVGVRFLQTGPPAEGVSIKSVRISKR